MKSKSKAKKKTSKQKVPKSQRAKSKMKKVMHEFKTHKLHIGKSKKLVKSRDQAVAIGLSEARKV